MSFTHVGRGVTRRHIVRAMRISCSLVPASREACEGIFFNIELGTNMNDIANIPRASQKVDDKVSRRDWLARAGNGFGVMALGSLLNRESAAAPTVTTSSRIPHFVPTAKAVISLFMQGGPSQVDTFDPKPELERLKGQPLPPSFAAEGLQLQFMPAAGAALMPSPFAFKQCGESGLFVSEIFSQVGQHADRLAVIRSCHHESFIHGPALSLMHTGSLLLGHPSVGAWVVYGLGCESDNLPAYVVMSDNSVVRNGVGCYGAGFLPAVHQGTVLRTEGAPIQNLTPPPQFPVVQQRAILSKIEAWNRRHAAARPDDSRLEARIANYELAFRMQSAAPELVDLAGETAATHGLYGLGTASTERFGRMCLLARRMVERGVRYVQLFCSDWDGHGDCAGGHRNVAAAVDHPIAGLLTDLTQRGLLDTTLVTWAGEFGRTPVMQGNQGRDHNPYGYTTWMAGGGIRGGQVIGATDELGFRAVEDKVHVNDLHATMLTLLGLDHEKLTYLFEGRNRRLTDVGGQNNFTQRLLS